MRRDFFLPYVKYILSVTEPYTYTPEEGEVYIENPSDDTKASFLADRFSSEYGWRISQIVAQTKLGVFEATCEAAEEWLRGLPSGVHIDYWNEECERIAKGWLEEDKKDWRGKDLVELFWKMSGKAVAIMLRHNQEQDALEKALGNPFSRIF